MVWVSVDGLEGAGKTTLVRSLTETLVEACLLPEFSSGFAGRALASAVKVTPHYVSSSAVAQSLFFLGEFVEKIEEVRDKIDDPHSLVISDRGLLSKIAYQAAVLRPAIGSGGTDSLLAACLVGLPTPDLTIWLRIEPQIAKTRVEGRGEPRNTVDLDFMNLVSGEFERVANDCRAERMDANSLTAREVRDAVCSLVVSKWPCFNLREADFSSDVARRSRDGS